MTTERTKDGAGVPVSTYPQPTHGWTCYHCGETFTTWGSAEDHFGKFEGTTPGCILRVQLGDERGWLMELRKEQESSEQQLQRALEAERDIERLECRVEALTTDFKQFKPFRDCDSANEAFFVYDSMEGRALAAEEVREALTQEVATLKAERDTAIEQFTEHTKVVGRFLYDMYATMIDPVEECNLKVVELCELLLKQAGEDREQLAALATLRSENERLKQERESLRFSIDYRLNEHLCDMKPEYDDSITGFNEAWDIMREVFARITPPAPGPTSTEEKADGN